MPNAGKKAAKNQPGEQTPAPAAQPLDMGVGMDQVGGSGDISHQGAGGAGSAPAKGALGGGSDEGVQTAADSTDGEPVGDSMATAALDITFNSPSANPAEVEVFPLRTYQDAGELRRRGGKGYLADKRHADALVQRKLASLHPLKE